MEDLAFHNKIVVISDTLMNLLDGILRITWNDTVNECTIYSASLFEPCLEAFSKIPKVNILIYALLEFLTVKEDKFTWKDDESLRLVTIEMVISVI